MALTHNKYMYYSAATTLASRIGGVLKPSIVTRSSVAGVATRDVGRPKKDVWGATADEVPAGRQRLLD